MPRIERRNQYIEINPYFYAQFFRKQVFIDTFYHKLYMLSISHLYQKIFAFPDLKPFLFAPTSFSQHLTTKKIADFSHEKCETKIKKKTHFYKLR